MEQFYLFFYYFIAAQYTFLILLCITFFYIRWEGNNELKKKLAAEKNIVAEDGDLFFSRKESMFLADWRMYVPFLFIYCLCAYVVVLVKSFYLLFYLVISIPSKLYLYYTLRKKKMKCIENNTYEDFMLINREGVTTQHEGVFLKLEWRDINTINIKQNYLGIVANKLKQT